MLRVDELSVAFRTPEGFARAVDGLSFDVAQGEALGIVGESGSGKTATAMAILGLLDGVSVTGSASLGGRELIGARERVLEDVRGREIAMVFQDPMTSLNPTMRIGRQVAEPLVRHRGLDDVAARRRVAELLDEVRIPRVEQVMRAYPHELSGGMRQRAAIAMALAGEPRVLLADEPTTALDVTVQADVLDLIKAMQESHGMAVVLITHDMGVVAHVADEVLVMYAGQCVERAPVGQLLARPEHPYTEALLGAMPRMDADDPREERLLAIPGSPPSLVDPPAGCRFAARCPFATDGDPCSGTDVPPALTELRPGHLVRSAHPASARASRAASGDG
ncbi:MAG: ABC transporter ATP-binding protein [Nocardioidaceae bacterium]